MTGKAAIASAALFFAALAPPAARAGPEAFARDGLLIGWEARTLAGKALPDDSGQGNHATLVGAAKLASDPPRLELDGRSALVGPRPVRPERMTVEAVLRADRTYGPLQLIVTTFPPKEQPAGEAKGNPRQWVLEIRGNPPQGEGPLNGHLSFGIFGEDGRWHFALSNTRLRRGWHHALGTFDRQAVRLYLDGRLQRMFMPDAGGGYAGRINQPPDGVVRLPAAGASSPAGTYGFRGALAVVRLYSRPLSAAEAAANCRYAQSLVPPLASKGVRAMAKRPKPPFKVLFSNDTTNIETCTSPYHNKGEPFRPEMLEATVDETTGVDVHMLQPGLGWVPWWKSKVYPDHYRWWMKTYGLKPDGFGQYMLDGGDMVAVFVKRCRERRVAPFVSLRLNDGHGKEWVNAKPGSKIPSWSGHALSRFYKEHPEYRIGPAVGNWDQHVHNWAIPEVRDHKLAFIQELCEGYDIDGFELDFMRHVSYFQLDKTTSAERASIMTDFVARVRKLLDRTAKPGRRRWLCARVPAHLAPHDRLGIDLPAMVEAGLDMVNLSGFYFTIQQTDLPVIRELVPNATIYLEMTHCTTTGRTVGRGYDNFTFRRTTPQQFYTGAHLAYARGGDGASLFNFVYYREHGTSGRGPFNEPPFGVLERLGDPQWLARQPQWYVVAEVWNQPPVPNRPLPRRLQRGQTHALTLDMAPTEHQKTDGLLRLMTKEDSSKCRWTVKLNGAGLERTEFVSKPIDHPYEAGLGEPKQYACFACPRALVEDGLNRIAITLDHGGPVTVKYIDLVLP